MEKEQKTKLLSAASYVLAVANAFIGVFGLKRGYALVASVTEQAGHMRDMFIYVALPVLALALTAMLPALMRTKGRLVPAFFLGAGGMVFFAVWFLLIAPETIIGVMQ